jgi:hypothetical protein
MKFELSDSEFDCNTTSVAVDINVEIHFDVFFIINITCFVVYTSMAAYVISKSKCKTDIKGWANMSVNTASFALKMIAWTYLFS